MTQTFTLKIKLKPSSKAISIIEKQLKVGRIFYNKCLAECLKRRDTYKSNLNTIKANNAYKFKRKYEDILKSNKSLKRKDKDLLKNKLSLIKNKTTQLYKLAEIQSHFYLRSSSKNGMNNSVEQWIAALYKNLYNSNNPPEGFGSAIRDQLAERAFKTVEELDNSKKRKNKKNKAKFKKKFEFNTIWGKSCESSLRYKDGKVINSKIEIALDFDKEDEYHKLLLNKKVEVGRCGIIKQRVNGKICYYALICVDGSLPRKNHTLGEGIVGHDLGLRKTAIAHNNDVEIINHNSGISCKKKTIVRLQRILEKLRRRANPQNYNPDFEAIKGMKKIWKKGTVKKGVKLNWIKTKKMIWLENQIAELHRRATEENKNYHGLVANKLRSYGDHLVTEDIKVDSWKKAFKGKFAKSIQDYSPATFLDKIKFKFESTNGVFETVDPYQTAWTQTCSYCGHRATGNDKKTLADRIHRCYNCNVHLNKEIDRDVNSAINAKFWDKQKNCLCVNESKRFISGLHPDALAAKTN